MPDRDREWLQKEAEHIIKDMLGDDPETITTIFGYPVIREDTVSLVVAAYYFGIQQEQGRRLGLRKRSY